MSFLQYRKTHVRLYEDFTPLDKASRIIPKELFFRHLRTGRFFPLRLRTADSMLSYRLYRLADSVDTDLRQTIKR